MGDQTVLFSLFGLAEKKCGKSKIYIWDKTVSQWENVWIGGTMAFEKH